MKFLKKLAIFTCAALLSCSCNEENANTSPSDSDIIDENDKCPDDPNKTDPGKCGCGVEDTDNCGNTQDLCPDDPNKTEPGKCGCGVEDTDKNNNNIADCLESTDDDPVLSEPPVEKIVSANELPTCKYDIVKKELVNEGQKIYGEAYIPNNSKENKLPIFLSAHGLGGSYTNNSDFGRSLASHCIAFYTFDFRGGSPTSKSDGQTTDMSVMTEVSDLEVALKSAQDEDIIDNDRISIIGHSQGGLVTAITAARHPREIRSIVLLAPGFSIPELAKWAAYSGQTYTFGNMTLGKKYAQDIANYDLWNEIGKYKRKVLLIHGTADTTVEIKYSREAVKHYDDVEYHEIEGGNHGLTGTARVTTTQYLLDFVQKTRMITIQ